ncbi:MAG: MFS transporter [Desulfovibrio sp.]|nr:MFS transporter [Desulfovibrio sp.]
MSSEKENSTNDSFLSLLRAICCGNFNVLTGINLLMLMGYYLVFVTGTAYVQQTYEVSLSTAGFSSGLLVIGCLTGRFISGNQISRFGGRSCLLAGILLYSCGMVWLFFADSLTEVFVQRFVTGLGLGFAGTALGVIVACIVPGHLRGLGISLFAMSAALALALGPSVGIALIIAVGWSAVICTALLLSLLILLAFFLLRDLPVMHIRHRPALELNSYIDPRVLPFSMVVFLACIGYGCVQAFLTSLSVERGLVDAAGVFFLAYAIVAILTRPVIGRLYDLRGGKIIIYSALLLTAGAIFLLAWANTALLLLGSAVILGIGFANFQSIGHVIALSRVTRSRYAQATTTFFMAFDLGIGIGPFLFAMLIPIAGYEGMFSALGVLELCALALYCGIFRHAGESKHAHPH